MTKNRPLFAILSAAVLQLSKHGVHASDLHKIYVSRNAFDKFAEDLEGLCKIGVNDSGTAWLEILGIRVECGE